ncbi:MAG TPA: LuxR C-terminal-related transcriptional regulator [Chloroflexota bacterium]|nr:LuxR C-terminal-related transcriptional regulator [Chloroflexota bacterium]
MHEGDEKAPTSLFPVARALSGAELRGWRQALGLTQAQLADRLGVSATVIARWERGQRRVGQPERVRAMLGQLEIGGAPSPARSLAVSELPKELTSFVGREHEIAEVAGQLFSARILTLTGTGGVGKTRLALQVAERCQSAFPDGARFVDLAPIRDETMIAQAIMAALGLRSERDRPALDGLMLRLRMRHLLIVLDNCEHLLSGCSALAGALLRGCPQLSILATSREPLRTPGETVWVVPALKLPDRSRDVSLDVLASSEAGRLFVERAMAAQSSFSVRPDNAPSIAEICWRLDGIPLAIELAAARVRSLTVNQIATRLGDRFRLLSAGPRAGPARHQTLRAAVDWSYALLTDAERRLFTRLSVFAGGWTLEAAEAVCSDDQLDAAEVLQLLARLVDGGLVLAEEHSGVMRYRLFETLRQYGAELLASAGEDERLRDRQREWCIRVAEEGERDIWRADQLDCVSRLEREHDNVRTALGWTLVKIDDPEPGLRIAAAMVRFWDVHGDLREGMRWLTDLLALPTVAKQTLGWARALTARAYLTILSGDGTTGMALLDETLPFWHALGDPRGLAMALFFRALAIAWPGTDLQAAVPTFAESLALARQRGPRWTAYFCLYCLGEAARLDGDLARADALLTESLDLSTAAHDRWGAFHARYALAFLALARVDHPAATGHAQQSLTLSLELGDTRGCTYALETLGCIAADEGQARRAARLFGAAQALREPLGDFISATMQAARVRALQMVRMQLGERGFGAAVAAGRNMSLDDAVALAHGVEHTDTPPSGLTPRERDVARLVAKGLNNSEIAHALVLTERTTESHLTHIFGKLGLHSRTQLAAWALEHGLSIPRD